MTAMVPTNTAKLTGLVSNRATNTDDRAYKVIVVEDTGAASGETYALTNVDASITGVLAVLGETWNGAAATAAATWSTATITLPSQNGSYVGMFLCY